MEPLDPMEFLSRQMFFLALTPEMQEMITPEDIMLPQAEFEAKLVELDELWKLKQLNKLC